MPDSQFIAVVILLLLASVYVSRRAWSRLSALLRQNRSGLSCISACAGCETSRPVKISINR